MADKRVLLVDDDDISRDMLKEIIAGSGYKTTTASNGMEALDLFKKNPFPVIITDIEMPVMDGNKLIAKIKEIDDNSVIIVLTGHRELNLVIEIMKRGVFDYIIKPVDSGDLLMKLGRAFEVAYLRRMNTIREIEKNIKFDNHLSWVGWNEKMIKRDYEQFDRSLFKSLHVSFNQGAGFGSLLTLISLISSSAVKDKDGKHYLIDSDIFDIIKTSSQMAQRTIDVFSDINVIMSNEFNFQKISLYDLHELINFILKKYEKYKSVKQNNILFSENKMNYSDKFVNIDIKYFEKVIGELMTNAFKFSKKNSNITIIFNVINKNFEISFINDPEEQKDKVLGIPPEYENLVFEPFFRLVNTVYEDYDSLDYGLGLVIVEKIIMKHNGLIKVSNIKDFSDLSSQSMIKVDFTITLPLIENPGLK